MFKEIDQDPPVFEVVMALGAQYLSRIYVQEKDLSELIYRKSTCRIQEKVNSAVGNVFIAMGRMNCSE